jgi:hypothetical protein
VIKSHRILKGTKKGNCKEVYLFKNKTENADYTAKRLR